MQFVNYGLENLKWRQILDELKNYSFLETQKAVYAGNAIAILTPDRLGTFIGRFTYLKDLSKTKITLSTFVGNYAQLVTTMLFAMLGLIMTWNLSIEFQFPENLGVNMIISVMIFVCCTAIFTYYNQLVLLELLGKIKWKFGDLLRDRLRFMTELSERSLHLILITAVLRYLTFVVQFYIALHLFGAAVSFSWAIAFCGILYLFATIIPSPFMGNLGTREAIAVFMVSPLGLGEHVIAASLFIWLINVVLPSLIGGFILLRK